MVFLAHCYPYIKSTGFSFSGIEILYPFIYTRVGQLIVVLFLFYSGYGVMESIRNKKETYLSSFPRKRIIGTLLNFDIAVCFFIVLNLLLGRSMTIRQVLLSFTAWESVGNSNWYIFVILLCYCATYFSFLLFPENHRVGAWITASLVLIGWFFLFSMKPQQKWWFSTLLSYPVGVFYSIEKERIEPFVKTHYYQSVCVLLAVFLFLWLSKTPDPTGLLFNLKGIVFSLLVVLLTMRIKIGNQLLYWFGINLFPLYIYQRLPMITLWYYGGHGLFTQYPYAFIACCFVLTCVIALAYRYWKISL